MKITCPYLSQLPNLKHGFFEPNPDILTTARNQAMERMTGQPLPLVVLKQVHGNKVIHVTQPFTKEIEGDGLVTRTKRIALGVVTADCGPVLFYDPIAGIAGACHAGWKGARNGIIQATIRAMEEQGGVRSQIYATLGPTIQQMSYEVGPEFPAFFLEPYHTYFCPAPKEGHHYFNLPHYILTQLLNEGITQVHDLCQNTFTGNFASRRRLLSQGVEPVNFCNLSAIAIM